jgi:hypothetical protein
MVEWKKCKKKPIIVEFREPHPINNIYENAEKETKPSKGELVKTHEGVLAAIVGKDFIIKGIQGELYPIKKDIFYKTYDVVET